MTHFRSRKLSTIGECIPRCYGVFAKVGSRVFVAIICTCRIRDFRTMRTGNRAGALAQTLPGIPQNFRNCDCNTITTSWNRISFSAIARSIPFSSNSNSSSARTGPTNSNAMNQEIVALKLNFMKKILLILSVFLSAFSAQAKLNVVATLPDFRSIAREIGGDNVNVTVLAKPTEDPHFVDARPSFVVALRSADVLIDGGAELELGW